MPRFLVARHTPELGIRVALGPRNGDVLWIVLSEGSRRALLGMLAGSVAAIAVARAIARAPLRMTTRRSRA